VITKKEDEMAPNVLDHRPALRGWRRIFISVLSLVLLGLGTLIAVPGATAGAGTRTQRAGLPSTLVWGLTTTPRTLFGPTDYAYFASFVMTLIQGQMLVYGPQEQLEPSILSSWKTVNPLEYQYTVRSGVRFSDGHPVTAADIAYDLNLNFNKKLASQFGGLFVNVKSITYSGNIVTVKLSHPDALVRQLPATEAGLVYEQASVSKNLLDYGTPQVIPIGAGPYKVSSFVPDSEITLVQNPYWYGPKQHFKTIIFKIIPNPDTMLLSLRSGQINGTFNVGVLKEYAPYANLQYFPGLIWNGLTIDMTEKPFSDIHVREALYYATNRQALVTGADNGLGTVSSTVDDPGIYGNSLPAAQLKSLYGQIETFPYNITKAKQQLAMSSVPKGFTTTINVPADDPTDSLYTELLKSEWAQIGVNLKIRLMPGGPRFQIILNHAPNLGIQIIGNSPDGADPVEMPWEYFSSQQAAVNGNNSSNLRVKSIDSLINAAQASGPVNSAIDSLKAAISASKYVPIIPISWLQRVVALQKGWSMSALEPFVSDVYWTENIAG
jgi:peptide/nickel transport system substrate-binding protein